MPQYAQLSNAQFRPDFGQGPKHERILVLKQLVDISHKYAAICGVNAAKYRTSGAGYRAQRIERSGDGRWSSEVYGTFYGTP
jgi:hypothetical protein